jgi:hypothetical protein
MHRAVDGIHMHGREHARQVGTVLYVLGDGFVGKTHSQRSQRSALISCESAASGR